MFLVYLFPILSKPARMELYFVLLVLCNLCVFLREAHTVTMTLPHCHLQVSQKTEQNPLSEVHNHRRIFLECKLKNTCSFGILSYFRECRKRCVLLLEYSTALPRQTWIQSSSSILPFCSLQKIAVCF